MYKWRQYNFRDFWPPSSPWYAFHATHQYCRTQKWPFLYPPQRVRTWWKPPNEANRSEATGLEKWEPISVIPRHSGTWRMLFSIGLTMNINTSKEIVSSWAIWFLISFLAFLHQLCRLAPRWETGPVPCTSGKHALKRGNFLNHKRSLFGGCKTAVEETSLASAHDVDIPLLLKTSTYPF